MNDHTAPLSRELCDKVQPGLYDRLTALGVSKVLDVSAFKTARGYTPACSSIFLVGDEAGGSYDSDIVTGPYAGYSTTVHNGTLLCLSNPEGVTLSFGALSDAYEKEWKGAVDTSHAGPIFQVRLDA